MAEDRSSSSASVRRRLSLPRVVALVTTGIAVYLAVLPPLGMTPQMARAAALVIFAIGLWSTGTLPEYLTALIFFLLAMLFAVAPGNVIFSGFESAAFWLVFGGLVIGVAVKRTGTGDKLASWVADRLKGGYFHIIAGTVAMSLALGFVVPSSMGRAVMLIPIALALADHFGFAQGSNGRTGLVLAVAFGAHIPPVSILTANVPNLVLFGSAETLYHVTLHYGPYLLLHFPVLGILKSLVIMILIVLLYPDTPRRGGTNPIHATSPGLSRDQRYMAVVLLLALGFWMTDFLHHISPAWVALAAGIICLLPWVGLLPGRAFNEQINLGTLFFVSGILGMGALVEHSGLGNLLAHAILHIVPLKPGAAVGNFAGLTGMAVLIAMLTTLPGVPAVLTPLAGEMAKATGLPLETVLMTQVLGYSTVILPYESPPLIVGMQLGGQSLGPAIKLCLALSAVTLLVLLPLDFLWWRLLGWI